MIICVFNSCRQHSDLEKKKKSVWHNEMNMHARKNHVIPNTGTINFIIICLKNKKKIIKQKSLLWLSHLFKYSQCLLLFHSIRFTHFDIFSHHFIWIVRTSSHWISEYRIENELLRWWCSHIWLFEIEKIIQQHQTFFFCC